MNTRRGFYTSLAVQEGFRIAGAGFPYLRVVPEVRAFWSFGPKLTVAARARVGALVPLGGADAAPIIARFYAGGPNSMRGYYTRRLSPMSETEDGEFVAVGGEQLTDGSLELRFPIAGALGGTLFLDAGDVPSTTSGEGTALRRMATSLVGALDPRDLQYAAGLGLRYRTPFGPLAFDVGVRLPKRSGGRWVIPEVPSGGGAEHTEPLIGAHLSLGEAF